MEAVCEDEVENYTESDGDKSGFVLLFLVQGVLFFRHNIISWLVFKIYSDGIPFTLFHLDQICFPQTNNT